LNFLEPVAFGFRTSNSIFADQRADSIKMQFTGLFTFARSALFVRGRFERFPVAELVLLTCAPRLLRFFLTALIVLVANTATT